MRQAVVAVALCLFATVAIVPLHAAAQNSSETPAPKKLWNAFPLGPTVSPEATRVAAPPSAGAQPEREPVAASRAGSGGGGAPVVVLVLLALFVLLVAGAAARFIQIRRRRELEPAEAAALSAPRLVASTPALAPPGRDAAGRFVRATPRQFRTEPVTAGDRPPVAAVPSASPPDPARGWTAEIEWRQSDGEAAFRVVGHPVEGRGEATISESARLEWPPEKPETVEGLRQAAEALEVSLLAAGWEPLPPGERWYSKRFAWEARQRAAAAAESGRPPASGRFARDQAWDDALDQWRCEIEWDAGYINSRFKATAFAPGNKRGATIGESATFKWMVMEPPKRQERAFVAEVRRLAAALVAAGWRPLGRGSAWYSTRYVWDGEEPPPDHVELAERSSEG